MPRTGTTCLSSVFLKPGYITHQTRNVLLQPKNLALWQEAINVNLPHANVGKISPLIGLVHSVFNVHDNNLFGDPVARATYENHYYEVRRLVTQEQLLVLHMRATVEWKPLRGFLVWRCL
jgi:hypothetical protein